MHYFPTFHQIYFRNSSILNRKERVCFGIETFFLKTQMTSSWKGLDVFQYCVQTQNYTSVLLVCTCKIEYGFSPSPYNFILKEFSRNGHGIHSKLFCWLVLGFPFSATVQFKMQRKQATWCRDRKILYQGNIIIHISYHVT